MAMDGSEEFQRKAIEFLGSVPLLHRLPISSLKKIVQLVVIKHYDKGERIVREGEVADGVYFIWEGEAEVSESVDDNDDIHSKFQLRQYDYFGDGVFSSLQQADVIALTKVTCLLLPHQHCSLLRPKSIWSPDKINDSSSLIEKILLLEPLEFNIFQGISLPEVVQSGNVYGGQFLGQALAAASKTVDHLKIVHSLHALFLVVGDVKIPIIYEVHCLRDGGSFASRCVHAIQKGVVVFKLLASFQREELGFDHQEAKMPTVPEPETLLTVEELLEKQLTDPRFTKKYRKKLALIDAVSWPIEVRLCVPQNYALRTKSLPGLTYWFRARGKLSDDQALHSCVVAYASDQMFLPVSLNPHRNKDLTTYALTLDHSMWFHRTFRADEWLLYTIESPTACNARGFVAGQIFNRYGQLVISSAQEGLIRKHSSIQNLAVAPPPSKL